MTTSRERLVNMILASGEKWRESNTEATKAEFIADALLAAGATLPEAPAPLKVWPGMEGDGLRRVLEVFDTAYDDGARRGLPADDLSRAARTAQTAYLWRALVASLPVLPDVAGLAGCVSIAGHYIPRAALAALADPYDGGGKGVGK